MRIFHKSGNNNTHIDLQKHIIILEIVKVKCGGKEWKYMRAKKKRLKRKKRKELFLFHYFR